MKKYLLILFLNSLIFLYGKNPLFNDLILLNNPVLNNGNYKDNYKIYNLSFGREFFLNKHFNTSLYLIYSKINNKDKYYGIKSSLGFYNAINKNLIYAFGLSTLFLKKDSINNISSLNGKIIYQFKSSYNPYIKFQVNYDIFNLPKGQNAPDGIEAQIDSGFAIDLLKWNANNLPVTINPYIQYAFYSNKLQKELEFNRLCTIGLEIDYRIGEYLRKNSSLHSAKIKFKIQKTFSNKKFSGYNFSIKLSLFDF